ncbi:MAG: MotA/TolQ/ExbB proton channel family protein [Candidatus Aminicenantes bacterium]|nr:MotA/TolQ/ExbB proton channel family protein [Candidatus Aminicenantes bacterium]
MKNVWDFLAKGGIIMIPLFLCSITALAIIIEKFVTLRRRKVIVPEVVGVLENVKGVSDLGLAVSICEKHHGPFANIIRLSLENHGLPREDIKETLLDQGRQEIHQLEKGLGMLETIAGISPLLGLLGTVLGILKVFKVISVMGVGQAAALAGGISEALITTIVGLFIGIPALVAFNYFTSRAEALVLEIEKYSNHLLNKICSFQSGPGK